MLIAWLITFPAAGIIAAAACSVAKINVFGTAAVVVMAAIIAIVIFRLSRRNPVNSLNVNEGTEVKINLDNKQQATAAA